MTHRPNRRKFLESTAAIGTGFWVAGRATWADELASKSPNERINIASIGIGGKGDSDSAQAAKHGNLIGICDIDDKRLDSKNKLFPKAERFNDFRQMFDKLGKEIDIVTVSTPDHTHAVATMMAIKLGKHVYTQKPMTHDVWEARQLQLAARQHKVATQMGNQGSANNRFREGVEVIASGMIGAVREVHVWTNRPIWPQSPVIRARPPERLPPTYLHWDEWLGTAPARPYGEIIDTANPKNSFKPYHPRNWRGWWEFGTGALGDMGCHSTNLPFRGLKLGHPSSIVAECEELNGETYPGWAKVIFEFPAREHLPPVKLTWYEGHKDGNLVLPPKKLITDAVSEHNKILLARDDKRVRGGKKMELSGSGSLIIGDKGTIYSPTDDGIEWELVPADLAMAYKPPTQIFPRNPLGDDTHTMDEGQKLDWLAAIKGAPAAPSNFDFAGLLTEFILLGNIAIRHAGTKLDWDGPAMKFPNAPQAEKWLKRQYREPWAL